MTTKTVDATRIGGSGTDPSEKLPERLDEITPEFLTKALSARWPGVTVRGMKVAEVSEGTASRAKLELTYEGRSAAAPATMWVKSSFNQMRQLMSDWKAFEGEARFYHSATSLRRPDCYYAAFDETSQSLVLLEDLATRGATFGHVTKPCTFDQAKAVLTEIARFHGEFWRSPRRTTDMSWYPTPTTGPLSAFFNGPLIDLLPKLLERGRRRDWVPEPLRKDNTLGRAFVRVQERNTVEEATLTHYDWHVGNVFFEPDGRAGVLDFQGVRWGRWAQDVGYFLMGGVRVEDRRAWERDLIEHYLAELRANGGNAPTNEQAFAAYSEQAVFGLLMWLTTMPEMQPEHVCEEYCLRYATAATDLNSLAALDM